MAVPAAAGLGCVLALVAWSFWRDGALWALYWTAFEYPETALISAPQATFARLGASTLFFLAFYLAWAFFIVLALADWWYRERHILTTLFMAWFIVAVGLIVMQRFSWWSYHFQLLFTPAGLLGVRGIGVIPRILRARRAINDEIAALLVIALAVPTVGSLAIAAEQKFSMLVDIHEKKHGGPEQLRETINPLYGKIKHSVRFLSGDATRAGPIYVFGDPLYYYFSGRRPALPIPGWAWQYFLQSQWVELPRQLAAAMPPYIYVDRGGVKIMQARNGGVQEFIRANYAPFTTDHDGTWYQIRPELWRQRHGG
jgi:hypothetical protein